MFAFDLTEREYNDFGDKCLIDAADRRIIQVRSVDEYMSTPSNVYDPRLGERWWLRAVQPCELVWCVEYLVAPDITQESLLPHRMGCGEMYV